MNGIISSRLIRTDRNGTQYFEGMVNCPRCGGQGGAECWKNTGWTCYECGGKGMVADSWKVMTPEYEEKLRQRRIAKAEKQRAYEEAHAEEIAKAEVANDCAKSEKAIATCTKRKGTACEGCQHKAYCNLLSKVLVALENGQEAGVLTDGQSTLFATLQGIDRTEHKLVKVETLEGEPCEEGKWFDDFYGNSKRVIVKPDGEKVYTSATSQRGLAKYGVRYSRAYLIELAKQGIFYNREETKVDALAMEMKGKHFYSYRDEDVIEEAVRRGIL